MTDPKFTLGKVEVEVDVDSPVIVSTDAVWFMDGWAGNAFEFRNALLRKARTLADFFGMEASVPATDEALVDFIGKVLDRAENAALADETTLGEGLRDVNRRFDMAGWPADPVELIAHLRTEIIEIEHAIADAKGRPDLRAAVLDEIGDALVLLLRLGLCFGARTAMEPLALSLCKITRRLGYFESLVSTMDRVTAWHHAKEMAAR